MNNNKHIDLWEVGGRGCFNCPQAIAASFEINACGNLAQAAVIAIGFEAVIYKEQALGKFVIIAAATALVFLAAAGFCFAVYNRNINNNNRHD